MPMNLPDMSLVLLVGASGSGKSTFAARHFEPFEVLSSDHYRGVVANDPRDQAATADAFAVLADIAGRRLARGLLTVIDATNARAEDRAGWVRLARKHHMLCVAIVLDVPDDVALARNAARPGGPIPAHALRGQARAIRRDGRAMRREGFSHIHHLRGVEAIDAAAFTRTPLWSDRREERGPFDLIGDVHGCFDELCDLLTTLGWTVSVDGEGDDAVHRATPPEPGVRLLFLGDLCDRGPKTPEVFHLVMDLVDQGVALCVPGNHEAKLAKWLAGKQVTPSHGLQQSIDQLSARSEAFRARVAAFIDGLVSHLVLDGGALVAAHAGMREDYIGRASGKVRAFALYGDTTGEIDAFGLPVRYPWAEEYRGRAAVVYGHTPVPQAEWIHNTLCIDTGCVFGGALTALRWPSREIVSVPARATWFEPVRPALPPPPPEPFAAQVVDLADVSGAQRIETRFRASVPVREAEVAAAIEVASRFTVDPRWLLHLPPTMSPVETSSDPGWLERPEEAFADYRRWGVTEVVCEEKHMGSRAMLLVLRDPSVAVQRFGFAEASDHGVLLSRRGRRFLGDPDHERALLARAAAACEAAGLWRDLATDWVLLDAEVMPWSAKAQALLTDQYAPVGAAGRAALDAAVDVVARTADRLRGAPPHEHRGASNTPLDVEALRERVTSRRTDLDAYVAAYRRYCWPVDGLEGLAIAPFHVLASEGAVHTDKDHRWHLAMAARLADHDPLFRATQARWVPLDDDAAIADAVAWWTALTDAGGEGMVVKPATFLAWHKGRLVQPALKVRGREYLRIIYGPEYTRPEHMARLRARAVRRKRTLAGREFVLGLEALHRFVDREPLRRVHQAVLGILALEAEPIDPRL